jgi:hypothetical protein
MIGEFRGTIVNPGNSGFAGPGSHYFTALDLKNLSEVNIAELRKKITSLEADRKRSLANKEAELQQARTELDARKASLALRLKYISDDLSTAQSKLSDLESGRETALAAFVLSLKSKPNFVPLSFGVASQFRALRTLYNEYGSTFEMIMIKLLIMMLEMTPVLQKVFLSPTTLYAVKLDAAKRARAYTHFDDELRLRQDHLRRKADAAMDEALDEKGIQRVRQSKVTPIHEAKGVG